MAVKFIKVTKLDAVRRQLDAALILFFNDGDPVAIHALAAACHDVLRDLLKKTGGQMLIERSLAAVGEEFVREIRDALRAPQNFFKHADSDNVDEVEFSPALTEHMIADAVGHYQQLSGDKTLLQRAYEAWFSTHYPQYWKQFPEHHAGLLKAQKAFGGYSRQEFLRQFLAHNVRLEGA